MAADLNPPSDLIDPAPTAGVAPPTDLIDPAAAPPAAPASPPPVEKSSNIDVARNAVVGGLAAIPDMIGNLPNQVLNLSRATAGTIATALGHPDLAEPLTENPDGVRKLMATLKASKPGVVPQGFAQKAMDALLRGGAGGALMGAGSIPGMLAGAMQGAVAQGAATGAGELARKAGANDWQTAALENTAGMLAPAGVTLAAGTIPRAETQRTPDIPPERLKAYREMTAKGARPSAESLIYGEANKNVNGQQRVANETWNEAVGLPKKTDFGTAEVEQARQNIKGDYERLLTGRQVTFDKPFFDQFKSLFDRQRQLAETGITFAEARPIIATLEKIANLPQSIKDRIEQLKDVPPDTTSPGASKRAVAIIDDALKAGSQGEWKMDAKDYNEVRSILGKDAQRSRRDTNRSGVLWKMQQAFDDAADRSMPDIAKELGETRGKYENLMILSDAMVGKGPGFVTPAQIGAEVAQRAGHRSLYPNQTPLKELGRQGLSLSGDAKTPEGVNARGMAVHAIPNMGISLSAIERGLMAPRTALRARGMASEKFPEKAKAVESNLKEGAKRSIVPLAAADAEEKARQDEKERRRQALIGKL